MRIAHFGTFDVENYGDLLFPLILELRLSGLCDEFVHVSPVGSSPPWTGCVETIGFRQFAQETSDVDGVVVGGGQIIRATPTPLEIYNSGGISSFLTYPGLWLGASYIAASENLPLCWNAAGVPSGFTPIVAQLVQWSASVTDYVAVRDEASRRWLQEAGVEQNIGVVPDTAVEVCRLWTKEEVAEAYEGSFFKRERSVPDRTLVCHVNSRWAGEDLGAIAARIDRICRQLDATAILIAIGPVHGDSEVQRKVAARMGSDPLLIDKPQSLREVAACIARSEVYLGSSLHGMITACSFGKRGMMIASGKDAKYSGFLQHFGLSSWLAESWEEAEKRVGELLASSSSTWESISEHAAPLLDQHWSRVRATLARSEEATGSPQDKRFALGRLNSIGRDRYGDVEPFHAFIAQSLETNQAQLETMKLRLAEESRKLGEVRQELKEAHYSTREMRQRLKNVHGELRVERQSLKVADREITNLVLWIEELGEGVSSLSSSRRRKIGRAFGRLRRKALRQPGDLPTMDRLEAVLERFRAWRRERNSRIDRSRGGGQNEDREGGENR